MIQDSELNPQVSIVTPVYNTGKYLKACLDSVLNQSFSDWEMILIDDCSSDDSRLILDEYCKRDNRFILIKNEKNEGSGISRNKGIDKAKGRYLCFLDSDDTWHKDKLAKQFQFMKQNGYAFSFHSYDFTNEEGEKILAPEIVTTKPVDYKFLLKRTIISTITVMIDLEQTGKFYMPRHRRKQDYGLWLSLLKSGYLAYGMVDILATYRQRKGSATSNKWTLIWKHVKFLKETQGLSWVKSFLYTGFWAFNGFVKYYLR
ncbi:glycosyltransferase family 2 protein [Algoriphagus kandeliae]|uniref:Glycosyltransferase family 2 protein n=1 Tax=Algoriphagus kandeliae TaxID=2562278 RepID=A0A4Y9R167_9BACT|nr:glycosyltransferase family 2 protein [Algoriphagus kandeliae]TFV97223.1 glycosyltransferase family 2 protein [Algoriphagus kandeliae]